MRAAVQPYLAIAALLSVMVPAASADEYYGYRYAFGPSC